MKYRYFFTILFLSLAQSVQGLPIANAIRETEAQIMKAMKFWHQPGFAFAVVHQGKIIALKTFGVRKIGSPELIDEHTVFPLASTSKTFAATLSAILVDQQQFKFDDLVIKHIPDLQLGDTAYRSTLQVQNLLSQTTGAGSYALQTEIEKNFPMSEQKKLLSKVKILAKPGAAYTYQNSIFSLIGDIISTSQKGASYCEVLKTKLIDPLHLKNSSCGLEPFLAAKNKAFPHYYASKTKITTQKVKPFTTGYYTVPPAGGVNASLEDLAKFLQFLLEPMPKIVKAETVQDLFKPRIVASASLKHYADYKERLKKPYYGLGWRQVNYAQEKMVYHAGGFTGINTMVALFPEKQLGLVVLSNGSGEMVMSTVAYFLDSVFNLPFVDWTQRKIAKFR